MSDVERSKDEIKWKIRDTHEHKLATLLFLQLRLSVRIIKNNLFRSILHIDRLQQLSDNIKGKCVLHTGQDRNVADSFTQDF